MTFLKLAQREFSALQLDSVHLVFYFLVFTPMCFRTLANLHCWDTELPKPWQQESGFLCFPLISTWHQMEGGGGGGEDIVSLSPKLHLLILDLCGSGDWCCLCCFLCVWSHPRLVLSWMFSLRLSLKITSLLTPPTSVAVYLESATASGESRGAFWSLLAHSQFCCLGRFYRRGVTQLCIVFYSLALLGVHLKFGSSESTK